MLTGYWRYELVPAVRKKDLINLFNVNPPPEELLEDLFIDRENEMAIALDALASDTTVNEILAVHGETRTGKSHFVRVLLKKLPRREAGWRTLTVMANHRGGVRPVLEDIFKHVWELLHNVRDKVASEHRDTYEAFVREQDRRRALLLGDVAEQSRETSSGRTESLEAKATFGPAALAGAITDRVEERTNEGTRDVARTPSDAAVVEWVRDILSELRVHESARPVLLFVDDLDLLERRKTTDSTVCADLIQRLLNIATHPHAVVIVTVRTAWFNKSDKELNNFVQLKFFDDDVLRLIYQRHIDVLFEGRAVLDDGALDLVTRESNGQVGMFLKTCRDMLQWSYSDLPITTEKVSRFVDAKLREFRRLPDCVPYLPAIERALRAQELTIQLKGDLHETPLMYTVLTPVPNQAEQYILNPLWSRAILRAQG